MTLDAAHILARADRPLGELTRRDVARLLLSVPAADALSSLPGLRRALLTAHNPFSAAFWESAESVLGQIVARSATVGDVRQWLEATGTEPTAIIGLHVWEDETDRAPLAQELHARLVGHLEERLAAGDIDPDRLLAADPAATQRYRALQERWMTEPLPDGRVPMTELLDEADEEFIAEWDAAEQAASDELRDILDELGDRPLPQAELQAACRVIRIELTRRGRLADLLRDCGGVDPTNLPTDDAELWLTLAAGVANPVGEPPGDPLKDSDDLNDLDLNDLDDLADGGDDVSLAVLDHNEWLEAVVALAQGGPGTRACAEDLARFASEPDDDPDDIDVLAGWFATVVELWQLLGAVDDLERLTPLGWWGIPEALLRAWAHEA